MHELSFDLAIHNNGSGKASNDNSEEERHHIASVFTKMPANPFDFTSTYFRVSEHADQCAHTV